VRQNTSNLFILSICEEVPIPQTSLGCQGVDEDIPEWPIVAEQ
jgi:hypothetical protein